MINVIEISSYFERKDVKGTKWLDKNPYNASTDRELCVIRKNLPIYRAMFIRNGKLFIN
jgi:tRNA (guanine-N7-)-methyltransferase